MTDWFTEEAAPGYALRLRTTETLHHGQSAFQDVLVARTEAFGVLLALDGLVQTTERDEFFYHELIAHVPLFAHPSPERVLVVGGGDGGTVREVLRHACVRSVELCEIDGEVVRQCRQHLPDLAGSLDDPRVTVHIADAIQHVKERVGAYDVVIVDSSDPVGPGDGLFTPDFYRDVRSALRPGGLVCVQTESPFAMPAQVERAYRSLLPVFPRVDPFVGVVPSYPGGLWSWALCSVDGARGVARPADLAAVEAATRCYTGDVHAAAFALPSFFRRQLASWTAA